MSFQVGDDHYNTILDTFDDEDDYTNVEHPALTIPNEAAEDWSPPDKLSITIRDSDDNQIHIKMKRTNKLGKAMRLFASRKDCEVRDLRFLFEGRRVNVLNTPDEVCRF